MKLRSAATTPLKIALEEDSEMLDEVVVVGYGVQKKKLVTGATVQVKGDNIAKLNTVNALGALQSQTPGVNITQSSGMPGEGFKVTIRGLGTTGSASPLYIIDGMPGGDINNLNPTDIESIDVLKDAASAAIYGSRAANGVILVTTKQGHTGKAEISYDGYYGVQNVYRMPDVLNAQEFAMIMSEARMMDGLPDYDYASLVPDWEAIKNGTWKGTNWLDESRNENAPIQNHALNITGGTEQSVYSIGLAYTDQEGILGAPSQPEYTRYTARINSEHTLYRKGKLDIIKVGENLTYRKQAISQKDIFISFDCVKHLVFPVQVSDIAIGEQELVMASRVEEAPHIVRLSAQAEGFTEETNLTVVCIDGSVYTYHIRYLPEGGTDSYPNIYEDNGKWQHHDYQAEVSDLHLAEFFFPEDIAYGTPGNEVSFTLAAYNNQLKVSTAKDAVAYSNLFVVDKAMNTYHITIKRGNTSVFTYNFDDQRKYTAHVDVNSEEMERCIQELRTKKRNIYSLGVIENKFELSMANLYVHEDFMFFIFDLKNKSYIDYDIEFVKCFQRDQKKSKNAIQQETTIEPIYQKDFDTKIKGKSRNRLILGFDKFTIPDDKVFEIEIYERNGGRHIKLAVLNEYILSAEPLYKPQP